jgi:hypothetical protein
MTDSTVLASTADAVRPRTATQPVSSALIYAIIALVALCTTAFHVSGPLGPDVSWLITVSERILAGGRLYIDILEPNPPMAGYLYMPPVLLAHTLNLPPEPFVVLWTVLFGLVTTGFSAWLVTKNKLLKHAELFWPVTLLLFLSAWGEDFAQREHFAAMAGLPLVVCLALRATGIRPSALVWIIAGIAGGFMLAIKPHFALPILAAVLYVAWHRRSIRPIFAPEMWLAGAIFLAFLGSIYLFYPAYFENIVPVASTVYIPDRRPLWLLLIVRVTLAFELITIIALLGFRQQIKLSPLLGIMFCMAVGFWLSYLAQGRGYPYQILPGIALMGSFGLLGFLQQADGTRPLLQRAIPIAGGVILAIMPMLDDVQSWGHRRALENAVARYGDGLKIANITPDLTVGSPLHRLVHGTLINSPPGLLMSISAWRLRMERHPTGEWADRIDAVENGERTQLKLDLQRQPPDIIVTTNDGFDWLEWAEKDPDIKLMIQGYEDIGQVKFADYYLRLLKRKGLEPKA